MRSKINFLYEIVISEHINEAHAMATEEGVVEKIVKDKVVVRIQKTSACTH